MATDRLTSLTTELLVKVLEVLPARDISKLRAVSRGLCDFVDKNEVAIVRHTIMSNRKRLVSRIRWLMDLRNLDLIDIVHRYCSYYGNIEAMSMEIKHIILGTMVTETFNCNFEELRDEEKLKLVSKMTDFFLNFKRCHNWMRRQTAPSQNLASKYAKIKRVWVELQSTALQLTDPVSNIDYLIARLQDGKLMRGPHYTTKQGVPRYAITPRVLMGKILGLPAPLEGLGYCVKTEGMQKMVHDACGQGQIYPSDLRLAALIEEMFLF
ncbi:hypothetical protein LTR95_013360 [Oleoguttula sp. CCFEE 5521]